MLGEIKEGDLLSLAKLMGGAISTALQGKQKFMGGVARVGPGLGTRSILERK
jgi:hypothetical protein